MESAFGVEHPEVVSKLGFGSIGTKVAAKTLGAGKAMQGAGIKAIKTGAPGGIKSKAGVGGVLGGGKLRQLSGAMAAKPALTGGLAAGGAAAGGGALAGAVANRRRF